MGLDYATALIEGDEIAALTYQQNLDNLTPEGGEISLDDVALTAHQAVWSSLAKRLGRDQLALLTNENELRQAVAFEAVSQLVLMGYLTSLDAEAIHAKAQRLLDDFSPVYSSGDAPRVSRDGVPVVAHLSGGLVFSGDASEADHDYFSDSIPSVQ